MPKSNNNPICHEDKPCFAKRLGRCTILVDTTFKHGCTWCKEMDAEQIKKLKASLRGYNNK